MDIRKRLIEMLNTENAFFWTDFMLFLDETMPFLNSKGRPTKVEIKNSIIGEFGFSSFKEMCDAKTEDGGIGWNYNTYRLWKKSWNLVKKHDYLKKTELTASEINTIYLDCIKRDIGFPSNLEELDSYNRSSKSEIKEAAAKANSARIKDLLDAKAQITVLQTQIEDIAQIKLENATLRSKNESLEQMLVQNKTSSEKLENALQGQIDNLTKTYDLLKVKFEKREKIAVAKSKKLTAYEKMSLWKRIFNYTVTI